MRLWAIRDRQGNFIKHKKEDRIMFFGIAKNAESYIHRELGSSPYLDIVAVSEKEVRG